MDMVAAIQAAKSQLEAETTKKQATKQPAATNNSNKTSSGAVGANANPQGTGRHQKSNSFQFGGASEQQRPPTSIVSFKESSRGHQQQSQQLQQGLQQLNWKNASSSPSSSAIRNSSSSSLPPLHGDYISSEYQYGVNKYNNSDSNNNYNNQNDFDNDNYSITSSLSGTLPDLGGVAKFPPPPPPPPPPALTRDHLLAGLNLLPSTNSLSTANPPTTTSTSTSQSKGSTSTTKNNNNTKHHTSASMTSSSTSPAVGANASIDVGVSNNNMSNNSNRSLSMNKSSSSGDNNNNSNNITTSIAKTSTTTNNNNNNSSSSNTATNITNDDSNINKNNNANVNSVSHNNSKSSTSSSSSTSDDPAKRRIEEIMSEYQGRVDSILRRQRSGSHGDIKNDIMMNNTTAAATTTITNNNTTGAAAFAPASPSSGDVFSAASVPIPTNKATIQSIGGPGGGGEGSSIVEGTKKKIPHLESSSPTVNVDDILSTYKKRVGEIMSKASPSPIKVTNMAESKMTTTTMMNPPQLPITLAVDNVILDDEISDYDRESAVDGVVSEGGGGGGATTTDEDEESEEDGSDYDYSDHISGDGSKRSTLGSSSSTSRYAMNSRNDINSNGNNNTNNAATRSGSMSERANAVLQSIHSPGGGGRGEGDDGRIVDAHSESSSGVSTHISGASSASELSARNERAESSRDYYSTQDHQQQQLRRGLAQSEMSVSKTSSDKEKSSNLSTPEDLIDPRERRQGSLLRAQELTASTTFEAVSRRHSMPKNYFQDDSARVVDLEKRLSEALLREEELSRENIRLEKNLKEARSELDKVQSEARSIKYSSSEQASRISELERKLRNEKERYEELERERDVMKEEYEQDLEDQKDINRQLEQMVMSEEFEKELEDEINQVKELEHANRRFKVKIDMLERERNTIAKKYETKIEDYTNKISSLEEQLAEWESRAGSLENNVRNTAEEWEAKLAEEKRNSRDMQFDLEKAQTKLKGMEAELIELRDSSSKIDEYEQVLGKLMERNEELEGLAKSAKDELEMTLRQEQLSDRRRAVKMKDLEDMIEEQRITIEQQQETLDESVKTILKLYSLNNEKGGDLSVLTEEKLTDMARAMVPRLGSSRPNLPPRRDEDRDETSGYTSIRPSVTARNSTLSSGIITSRGRDVEKEVDKVIHEQSLARSRGRTSYSRLDDSDRQLDGKGRDVEKEVDKVIYEQSLTRSRGRTSYSRLSGLDDSDRQLDGKVKPQIRPRHHTAVSDDLGINNKNIGMSGGIARHSSRGRGGERTESIRQLTERARTPARDRDRNRSPAAPRTTIRRLSTPESYDPKGPMSDSLALVPVATPEYSYGGQYDIPPPRSRSVGRREMTDDRDRSIVHDPPHNELISYNPRPHTYDKHHSSSTSHSNRNQYNLHSSGTRRDRNRIDSRQQTDRERDRRERDKGDQRIIDRNRDRDGRGSDRNRGWSGGIDPYHQGVSSERGGGFTNHNRSGRDRSSTRDRESRSSHRGSNSDGHGDAKVDSYSYSRRPTRDRSPTGETDLSDDNGARAWRGSGGKHHGGKAGGRSSRRDP